MLLELDARVVGGALLLAALLRYVWQRFYSLRGLPPTIPWAGTDVQSAFARGRSSKRSLLGLKQLIQDGYQKHSKHGRPFVLPNIVTGPEVVVPMSQLPWLMSLPDDVLSQHEVNKEFLNADRVMLHPRVSRDTVHGRVIRKEMTKDLDSYSDDIADEIEHALGVNWGHDQDHWTEVAVYDTMLDVISRISNRVLVGAPLCRDPAYLKPSSTFARNVVITAGLINMLPQILQPLLSPFILAYDYYQYWKITKFVFPIVKQRAQSFNSETDYKHPDYSERNDYIQWALHDAYSHDDPLERTPAMITKRLTVLSFAAIQSSVITITNCLFDIAASKNCSLIQNGLHEEVDELTASQPRHLWDRKTLGSLHRVDSALRESMRLWGFISRGVMKMVVAPQGISLPSGEHLPFGAKVGVTAYAIHHDEDAYPQASKFDAFRFARSGIEADGKRDAVPGPAMVTSSDTFMAFSHGRHACPGRFFAANQLKLLLAAIAAKYEIEPIPERPENPWLNNSVGPPIWSKLRVRRRPESPSHAQLSAATGSLEEAMQPDCPSRIAEAKSAHDVTMSPLVRELLPADVAQELTGLDRATALPVVSVAA